MQILVESAKLLQIHRKNKRYINISNIIFSLKNIFKTFRSDISLEQNQGCGTLKESKS